MKMAGASSVGLCNFGAKRTPPNLWPTPSHESLGALNLHGGPLVVQNGWLLGFFFRVQFKMPKLEVPNK